MFGKGDDNSQKRIMTRARRSDGKEKDEPTTSREYRNDRDRKEEVRLKNIVKLSKAIFSERRQKGR